MQWIQMTMEEVSQWSKGRDGIKGQKGSGKGSTQKGAPKGAKGQGKAAAKGKGAWQEDDRSWSPAGWPCKVKGCRVCGDGKLNWNSRSRCMGCNQPKGTVEPLQGQQQQRSPQYIPGHQREQELTRNQRRNAARKLAKEQKQENIDQEWGQVDELQEMKLRAEPAGDRLAEELWAAEEEAGRAPEAVREASAASMKRIAIRPSRSCSASAERRILL